MKKHKIIWFYIFTFLCTMILGGISTVLLEPSTPLRYVISLSIIQTSPLCGLLLLCIFTRDFSSFKEIKWGIFSFKNFIWILISILIPALIICGSAMILSILGKPYMVSEYAFDISLIVVIFACIIGCLGEELGWRGFLLPAFFQKYSLLSSSIFTGLLWGAWHFGKISLFGIIGYMLFILMVTEWTVLMAWIYVKTGKELLAMIKFHLTVNICSMFLLNNREGILFYAVATIIGGILCMIVILKDKQIFFNKS